MNPFSSGNYPFCTLNFEESFFPNLSSVSQPLLFIQLVNACLRANLHMKRSVQEMHKSIAAVLDKIKSFKRILKELTRLGVILH